MNKRFSLSLVLAATLAGLIGLSWWGLPHLVDSLPNPFKQRLPHEILMLVQTPLPTALPAPDKTAEPIRLTIPPLPSGTYTPTAVPPTNATIPKPITSPTTTATATPSPTRTPWPTPLPPIVKIDGLTIKAQKFNNCGPTNLSLALNFYGHTVDQLDIAAILKPNEEDRNVSPEELAAYVNEETPLRAGVYSGGDLGLLKQFIAAGFPVIVEKGLLPSEWEGWMGHYLTVYGYDDQARTFTSLDTFLGPWDGSGREESYETMAEFWSQFNYTFLIVYPPERETAVHTILGSDVIEPITMWARAARLAQVEIDTNPENPFAWFNLGTSLTHLGQLTGQYEFYESAVAAFDQARTLGLPWRMLWYQFQPYVAYLEVGRYDDVLTLADTTRAVEESFLYKGHALQALGDRSGATAVYQYALELNPNFSAARDALQDK